MPHPSSPIAKTGPRAIGRPPLPPDARLLSFPIRLVASQCDKLRALGGRQWVAAMLDATPMPRVNPAAKPRKGAKT